MRGCSVLTRPSSISAAPVTSLTRVTGTPASAKAAAVPPDETISHPRSTRPRASSSIPDLSETLINARFKTLLLKSLQHPDLAILEPHPALENQPAGLR